MIPRTLFLASRSPRRAALVQLLGIKQIEIHPADLEEEMDPSLGAAENVRRIAIDKARCVVKDLAGRRGVVLGADAKEAQVKQTHRAREHAGVINCAAVCLSEFIATCYRQ